MRQIITFYSMTKGFYYKRNVELAEKDILLSGRKCLLITHMTKGQYSVFMKYSQNLIIKNPHQNTVRDNVYIFPHRKLATGNRFMKKSSSLLTMRKTMQNDDKVTKAIA